MRTVDSEPVVDAYPARPWERPVVVRRHRRVPLIHIVLFVCTFITTAMASALQLGADPLSDPASIRAGFPFAVTLLSILMAHEMGHYTLALVHHVRATLPYFIPAPPLFIMGTFGAFIRMKAPPPSRRALFDVGAAGPWAGLIVAIPAVLLGLHLSEIRPLGLDEGGYVLGDSILFSLLSKVALGATPDNVTIVLHPIALAGWFGLLVTFLNLLPVGQLDGGHVSYALFGRWHGVISRLFLGVIAVLAFMGWQGWFLWVILLLVIGVDHPPTLDAFTPLDNRRRVAAWVTIGAFALTFMSNPIGVAPPSPEFEGDRIPIAWRPQGAPLRARGGLVVPFRIRPRAAAPGARGVTL